MWILKDLSNGDGAEGYWFPTYVWAYPTREQARKRGSLHRRYTEYARLGPVEKWHPVILETLYKHGPVNSVSEFYYTRKRK